MNSPEQRQQALTDAHATHILVLDGAMGTILQDRNLTAADFGGPALEGCNEYLVKTRPDVVADIHRAYLRAGSDNRSHAGSKSSPIKAGIWKLPQPEGIGVRLTESMMMDPEASVGALVFHHPACAYFTAADDRESEAAD